MDASSLVNDLKNPPRQDRNNNRNKKKKIQEAERFDPPPYWHPSMYSGAAQLSSLHPSPAGIACFVWRNRDPSQGLNVRI